MTGVPARLGPCVWTRGILMGMFDVGWNVYMCILPGQTACCMRHC